MSFVIIYNANKNNIDWTIEDPEGNLDFGEEVFLTERLFDSSEEVIDFLATVYFSSNIEDYPAYLKVAMKNFFKSSLVKEYMCNRCKNILDR